MRQPTAAEPASTCDISVVIPTRDRPEALHRCLTALAGQTLSRERFEVIVVNDGGLRPLHSWVRPFCDRLTLRLLEPPHGGPARARNVGAEHARGAVLAFTDDDCEPQSDWLTVAGNSAQRHPRAAIGGQTVNALASNPYATASHLLIDYLYAYHSDAGRLSGSAPAAPPFLTSNNLIVSARPFHQVGGFDESFPLAGGEDREFCDRWQQAGFELLHEPGAIVKHSHELTLSRFWRQHMNYGRGRFHLQQARAVRGGPTLRFEPLSFYWRLVMFPLGVVSARSWPLLVALLFISQVANALGFLRERRKARVTVSSQ